MLLRTRRGRLRLKMQALREERSRGLVRRALFRFELWTEPASLLRPRSYANVKLWAFSVFECLVCLVCVMISAGLIFRVAGIASIAALVSGPVCAAAFLQPPGEGQIILATTFDMSDRFFDANGRLRPVGDYRKFELQAYGEYGVKDWLTLIAAPAWSQARSSMPGSGRSDGIARMEAGARVRLWQGALIEGQTSVFSFQTSVRAPFMTERLTAPFVRREVFETDVRVMFGQTFKLGAFASFVSLEAAYRTRAGAADEWRADATLGVHFSERWLLLAQTFNIFAGRYETIAPRRSHKGQISAVYRINERWSLQAGAYHIPVGRNVARESGALAGVWRRF